MTHTEIETTIEVPNTIGMSDIACVAMSKVWMDQIVARMGTDPASYHRFGWMAEQRAEVEDILAAALRLSRGVFASIARARILYRLTKADTDTSLTAHRVYISKGKGNKFALTWAAQIKEMG